MAAFYGGNLGDVAKGALSGAILGAIYGGIDGAAYIDQWNPNLHTAARGVAGGVSSKIQGGSFSDGFKMSSIQHLANRSYKFAENWTDRQLFKSSSSFPQRDSYSGQWRSDGTTCTGAPADICGRSLLSIFGLTMNPQGGSNHFYDGDGVLSTVFRVGVVAVSKVHDLFNGWNYQNGAYVDRQFLFNTAYDVLWNFPGMIPAAAFTAYSLDSYGALTSRRNY